jgi:hypothetical protein
MRSGTRGPRSEMDKNVMDMSEDMGPDCTGTGTASESPTCFHHSDCRIGIKTEKGNHML